MREIESSGIDGGAVMTTARPPLLAWIEAWLRASRHIIPVQHVKDFGEPFVVSVEDEAYTCATNGHALLAVRGPSDHQPFSGATGAEQSERVANLLRRGLDAPAETEPLAALRQWVGAPVTWPRNTVPPDDDAFVRPGYIGTTPLNRNLVALCLPNSLPASHEIRIAPTTTPHGAPAVYVVGADWMALVMGMTVDADGPYWKDAPTWPAGAR